MASAWDDWISFEKDFQQVNLERVRENDLTPVLPVVDTALGSISKSFYDPVKGAMIGAFRYPGKVAHIGALEPSL